MIQRLAPVVALGVLAVSQQLPKGEAVNDTFKFQVPRGMKRFMHQTDVTKMPIPRDLSP